MNKNLSNVEISGIRKFFNEVSKYPEAISLTLGQPDFNVPENIKEAMIRAINENKTSYTANSGIIELREAISEFLKGFNVNYNKEEIIITVGGSEGLYTAMTALLNEGDLLLVPSIAYPAYEAIGKILGAKVESYKLKEDFSIDIEDLKKCYKKNPKLLIVSYPSNPTGALLDRETKKELIEVINENSAYVITDEIYSSLCFEDGYETIADSNKIMDKLIYISGFSKMFSMPGLRLGYLAAKDEILKEILKVHQYDVSSATSIVQWGALEGLKNSLEAVEVMKESFNERMNFVYNELKEMGIDVIKPNGAFYIFPSIKKFDMTSEEFCKRLLKEQGIACVPGSAFGKGGEGYMRISYCYSKEDLKKAMEGLKKFISSLEI